MARLLADQRVRFLIVGAVNTVVAYLLFAAFTRWLFGTSAGGYLLSLALSYAIAIVMAFVLYRRFVFRVSGNVLIDFIRFVGVYALTITINFVALPLLVEALHVPVLIAQALIVIVATLISFFGHRSFSFRRARPTPPAEQQPHEPRS
ncbi:GtrA family protein [Glaciibacter flavus]|uniref:GtrA family protein n=1 Tax=Orlajensenia flava TaxID=2565934 RepID=UPI003B00BB4A